MNAKQQKNVDAILDQTDNMTAVERQILVECLISNMNSKSAIKLLKFIISEFGVGIEPSFYVD